MKIKIAIYVEGGVVQSVCCSDPDAEVKLIDADDLECDPDFDIDGAWHDASDDLTEVW